MDVSDISYVSSGIPDDVDESARKRLRFAPRTNLACTQCRRRKTRCSGGWPTCDACSSRNEDCVYEGVRAQVSSRATDQHKQERTFRVVPPPAATPGPSHSHIDQDPRLPDDELRRKAISYFREHYAPTLLCFIPPQDLILDDIGRNLSKPLLLSILALVSKFIPEITSPGASPSVVSKSFANAALRELGPVYNKPTLSTVQACLILCIFEVGNGEEHQGWLRLGHAIRLAQLLKLHKLDAEKPATNRSVVIQNESSSAINESKRRTFWCAFCLDRLLANGRDMLPVLWIDNISTRLPQPDEDFIYGKDNMSPRLRMDETTDGATSNESLFAQIVRIVNIFGDIVSWHGNGGRHANATSPWLAEMPFTILDRALNQWRASLPQHLNHNPATIPLIIAAGQGRAWVFMFLLFHHARALLHKEYLPFTCPENYDPSKGPCDGPPLEPQDRRPSTAWWLNSATKMIESANAISELFILMKDKNLSASAYPFPAFSLLVAASIHIHCIIYNWPIMQDLTRQARSFLQADIEGCHNIGQSWPVGLGFVHQLTLYYELNVLAANGLGKSQPLEDESFDIAEIRCDIMKNIRELPESSRRPKLATSKFDFEFWISILDDTVTLREPKDSKFSKSPAPRQFEAVNSRRDSPRPSNKTDFALAKGGMFGQSWWDSWSVDSWNPELFR